MPAARKVLDTISIGDLNFVLLRSNMVVAFTHNSSRIDRLLLPGNSDYRTAGAFELKLPALIIAILADDLVTVKRIIAETPGEAAKAVNIGAIRENATEYFVDQLKHCIYAGDTPLHVAAMAYRVEIIELLVKNGADISARNRRGAEPLHYACDGGPTLQNWNPKAQFETVSRLVKLGACPNSYDKSGVAPLHRAVRNRCTGAVKALIECGADVNLKNKSGSTPLKLAQMTTGKSGSGSEGAKRECALIFDLLKNAGACLT